MMLDELIEKDLLQTKMRIAGDDGFNYGIFNIPSGITQRKKFLSDFERRAAAPAMEFEVIDTLSDEGTLYVTISHNYFDL